MKQQPKTTRQLLNTFKAEGIIVTSVTHTKKGHLKIEFKTHADNRKGTVITSHNPNDHRAHRNALAEAHRQIKND